MSKTPAVIDADKALLGENPTAAMPEVDLQAVASAGGESKPAETAEKQPDPVPSAAPAAPAPAAASKPALVDAQGRPFDPLLHEVDAGGNPLLRADGRTIKCRRVPLKEYKTASKVNLDAAAAPAADAPAADAADPAKTAAMQKASAATMAGLQVMLMRVALGPDLAKDDEDREALVECWQDMFTHYGVEKMHPLMGLGMVSGMIVFKSLDKPETQSRWEWWKTWGKVKVGGVWLWLTGRRRRPQADTDDAAPVKDAERA